MSRTSTSPTRAASETPSEHSVRLNPGELRGGAAILAAVAIMLVAANLRPPVVSVAPLIDVIRDDLGFSSATAGLLTTLPVLFFGLTAPIAPRIAARFGIERTIFASLALLIVGILLRLIPSVATLFLGSAILGAAIGVCNVVLPALIKRDFAHRSGLMTGLYSMTLSGGAAVTAAVMVPMDTALDENWRASLAMWALLAIVAMVVWVPQLRRVHTVAVGPRAPGLWTNPIAWAITGYMAAQSFIFYTFSAWLPQYLIDHGSTPSSAGNVLAIGQVVALIMSLVAPIIAGRFADQRLVTLGFLAVCTSGFIGLVFTDHATVLWVCMVMAGPGAAISLALLFMVLRSSSATQTGQVSGMSQSVGYILAAVGPIAIGWIHDVTGSWSIAFGVLALAVIPQGLATLLAAKNVRMPSHLE
ncbi:MFS transporter [Gordonia sputi]|uniref:CynX/NimT family MFS transporter n=1 Tax=Gordonia sputi TaxID=36823 RepID=UPI002044014F|nr:MFS transporter [Gordonia sputi]MCM3894913.1 MFS transporter [Gordonia sputi]